MLPRVRGPREALADAQRAVVRRRARVRAWRVRAWPLERPPPEHGGRFEDGAVDVSTIRGHAASLGLGLTRGSTQRRSQSDSHSRLCRQSLPGRVQASAGRSDRHHAER